MRKVILFSLLLVVGLILSQAIPYFVPAKEFLGLFHLVVKLLTLTALAFIMIHVGLEFELDKTNPKKYAWDYIVAMTAAAFPWIFVTLYFVFVLLPSDTWGTMQAWKETLLAGRFAAPTSAGVLFSMLAAAGLATTWLFKKARILAIFDDVDTVLLMIPLKMLMVGLAWQLGVVVLFMIACIWLAWRYLHLWKLPANWYYVLLYGGLIVAFCEGVYRMSKIIDPTVPMHLEVLLPAFVLGCLMRNPHHHADLNQPALMLQGEHSEHGHLDSQPPHEPQTAADTTEEKVGTIISGAFMLLVGLSMPAVLVMDASFEATTVTAQQPTPGWGMIILHVLAVTVLANIGKMFPMLCYRQEAHWKERLAVAIGMWPRGEVGAGVLVVSLSYGIGGPIVTIAMLSLALNLVLTGVFIVIVRRLLASVPPDYVPQKVVA
jgi:Kef-type K+ transport system membrane component KefB